MIVSYAGKSKSIGAIVKSRPVEAAPVEREEEAEEAEDEEEEEEESRVVAREP